MIRENGRNDSIPTRDEISQQDKWKLEDLYATKEEWEKEFNTVKDLLPRVSVFQGRLGESAQVLYDCLTLQEEISLKMERLFVYARMRGDEDTTDAVYQALTDRAGSLSTEVNSSLSFIVPEILTIPEQVIDQFFNQYEKLTMYKHELQNILRNKDHVLSTEQEALLAKMGELARAPQTIYQMIHNADMTFPSIVGESGEETEVTHGRFLRFMESQDRRVRKDAYTAVASSYEKQMNTIASALNASVKKDTIYAKIRNHSSSLAAALNANNIPLDVYNQLIDTVEKNLPLMHRYVSMRKKILGLDELHMYDMYISLVPDVTFDYTFAEAKELVLKSLQPLGAEYGKILEEGFQSGWIDVYETKGKRSGAYSWGAYGTHPYVLLNYQNNLNSVHTLSHELGHAMHTYYTDKYQPYVYSHYAIFVAEVASTVNESLLTAHLLKQTNEKKKRLYLINHYLDEFRSTLFRQAMFAEFEKRIHGKLEAGEPLTPPELKSVYRDLLIKYFGSEMVLDKELEVEWARVPHFYRSFYVYQYATGFSAAVALSKQILEEGISAADRYLDFLKSGSSDYPIALLKRAGVDMTSSEPVQQAMDVFAGLLDELEAEYT